MKDTIKQLVEAYGPSGNEGAVRALIEGLVAGRADGLRVDAMGNLIVLKKGDSSEKRIMVAAHMDEIGIIVTHVDAKGFLRFGRIGGVVPQILVGSRVRFANGTLGVIGCEQGVFGGVSDVKLEQLYIDVGAVSKDDAPVGVGDAACFERPFVDLGQRMVSKAMDDRIGCAVGLQTLLTMGTPRYDVYFVFTVQEEVGTRGAMVSAFGVEPNVGIALDVTAVGDTPEAHPMNVALGAGAAIKVMDSGAITHPAVKDWMIDTAETKGIVYQLEVLEFGGTDARAIQQSRGGVPAGCISIPTRYVHTPSEMVDLGDVEACVALLTALLEGEFTFG